MIRWLMSFCGFSAWRLGATPAELDRLHDGAGHKGPLIQILSEEGVMQSEELQDEMFPGRGGIGWRVTVDGIYAPDALFSTFREAFDASLEDTGHRTFAGSSTRRDRWAEYRNGGSRSTPCDDVGRHRSRRTERL